MKLRILLAALGVSSSALAAPPRVDAILGAPADAYEAAEVDGKTWLATSGGLVIESGGHVTQTLTVLDGLPGNRLRSISVLPDGVYVGGVDGAARLDRSARVVERYAAPRVRRVALLGGSRYAGAFGGGVVRLGAGGTVTPVSGVDPHAQVTDLLATSDHLYISTAGTGVVRLDAQGHVDASYRKKQGLRDDVVWDLELDGQHVLAATASGLSVLEGLRASARPRGYAGRDARAVAFNHGKLRVVLGGEGVYEDERLLAPLARARSLAGDLVLQPGGALRLDSSGRTSELPLTGLASPDVTSLSLSRDALWIGTFDAGLWRRAANGAISAISGVDARVNDVLALDEPQPTVLVATDAGLYQADQGVGYAVPGAPREHTSAIALDASRGAVWVAGAHTLARLEHGQWTRWHSDDLPALSQLDAVTVDAHGTVWAGGIAGLVRFDPKTSHVEVQRRATGALNVDWVTACTPWLDGLAVGTYNGGLSLLDAAGHAQWQRETDGLPSGWVNPHALGVLRNELWFGALDRGLVYGRPGAWGRLGIESGLPSNDVTAIAAIDASSAWLATRGGIAHVVW